MVDGRWPADSCGRILTPSDSGEPEVAGEEGESDTGGEHQHQRAREVRVGTPRRAALAGREDLHDEDRGHRDEQHERGEHVDHEHDAE